MRFTFKGIHHLRNGYSVVLLLMCFLTPLTAVLTSDAMGRLTEHVSESGIRGAGSIAAVTCGLYLIEVIVSYILTYCRGRINGDVYAAVQNGIQEHIFFGGLNDAGKYDINLYNSVSNDADEVCRFSSETFPNILLQTVNLIVIMTYMLIIDWKISVVYFAAVILSVGTQMIISQAMNRTGEEIKSCESRLNEKLADILRNRIIIKCYEAEEFAGELHEKEGNEFYRKKLKLSRIFMPLKTAGIICGMLPVISICVAGIYMIPRGFIGIGAFISVFYLCRKTVSSQLHYVDLIIDAVKTRPARRRISVIMAMAEKEKAGSGKPALKNDICAEDVWYRYPGQDTWSLSGVSMRIQRGSKVAFVGESGSGKSTMLKIIAGELKPERGKIMAGEAVFTRQFPHVFSISLRDNVSMGGVLNDSDSIYEKLCLKSVIEGLHEGDEAVLSENGVNLSGGQRQRIALARAAAAEGELYLFDESFSALDPETAKTVISNLFEIKKESTVIAVIHQREFAGMFDEVYEFDGGKVEKRRGGSEKQ